MASPDRQCDFCRLPCPEGTVALETGGETYRFCSQSCRDAMVDSDRMRTQYHGHRRFSPGVSALSAALPQGCPRNAFVLLSAEAGTRNAELCAELVWRTLRRGEPAVFVSFQEPPVSVVERFASLDWNVLPYLDSGQLTIVDCFSYRLEGGDRVAGRMSSWNRHLLRVAEPATVTVRDPTDTAEVANKIDGRLEAAGMIETGVVVLDSLTELGSLVQPIKAYDFVKDLRAEVPKTRFVPVFAGGPFEGEPEGFPHDLSYVVDGVVDLELNDEVVGDTLIKRLRVRKLGGALVYPEWRAYEFTRGRGLVPFDPREEMVARGAPSGGGVPPSEQ